jgi:hypothetical protein
VRKAGHQLMNLGALGKMANKYYAPVLRLLGPITFCCAMKGGPYPSRAMRLSRNPGGLLDPGKKRPAE